MAKIVPFNYMQKTPHKRIAILGSTGSIGRQALDVIEGDESLSVCALAAGNNWQLLAAQAQRTRPEVVAIAHESSAAELAGHLPPGTELLSGPGSMTELVRRVDADVLLSGVMGSAGLEPTLAAIARGERLAIANKETLVMGGAVVMPAARAAGIEVLPVDSEHSAIFQCLAAGRRDEVEKVTITASGGALRDWDQADLPSATVQDVLNHPTWQMGRKITVDSATMMNKALEMIEAHWLFDLSASQIDVVLHAESIVHSCVEFRDGSVIAQMGYPNMTLPIAYALSYPLRSARQVRSLDLAGLGQLTFKPVGGHFARAIELAYRVIEQGGSSGAVLNGANEAAVEAFLDGRISFGQIVELVEDIVNNAPALPDITLQALIEADRWARREVQRRIADRQ